MAISSYESQGLAPGTVVLQFKACRTGWHQVLLVRNAATLPQIRILPKKGLDADGGHGDRWIVGFPPVAYSTPGDVLMKPNSDGSVAFPAAPGAQLEFVEFVVHLTVGDVVEAYNCSGSTPLILYNGPRKPAVFYRRVQ